MEKYTCGTKSAPIIKKTVWNHINKTRVAKLLKINRPMLYSKYKKNSFDPKEIEILQKNHIIK